jgi:2',3'-cyclic-nucleotide 2'-phosphodiesterase (5'-nucleotidase family)
MAGLATLIMMPVIAGSASAYWMRAIALNAHGPSLGSVHVDNALDGTNSGAKETNFGDLVTTAAAASAQTQIALIPADEITATSVQPGSIDPEQIVLALSYYGDSTDTVQVLDLTGEQIQKALQRSASRLPQPYPGFLQVSGLKVVVNKGSITASLSDGSALDPRAHYKVATSAPLAAGELGYFSIWGSAAKPKDTGISLAQALRSYLTDNRQVSGVTDDRIIEH